MTRVSQIGTDRGTRHHKGACLAVAAAVLVSATPVHANLPPALDAVLSACLAEGLTHAERVAEAPRAGWVALPGKLRARAAEALAPWEIIRRHGIDRLDALSPAERAEDLALHARRLEDYLAAPAQTDHWFALADGTGIARIVDYLGDGAGTSCELSVALEAGDLVRRLDLPHRLVDRETVVVTLLDLPAAPADQGAVVSHLRLLTPEPAAEAIVVTPRMPRPGRAAVPAP